LLQPEFRAGEGFAVSCREAIASRQEMIHTTIIPGKLNLKEELAKMIAFTDNSTRQHASIPID
jgi:hypothetical protein